MAETLEDLTLTRIAEAISTPERSYAPELMPGKCHEICALLPDCSDLGVRRLLTGARPVHGHWACDFDAKYYPYCAQNNVPPLHSWLVLDDNRIFDVTRWTFAGKSPEESAPYVGQPGIVDPCYAAQPTTNTLTWQDDSEAILAELQEGRFPG